jgi:flagellin
MALSMNAVGSNLSTAHLWNQGVKNLASSINRISTTQKTKSVEDAAGIAVAHSLKNQVRQMGAKITNIQNALSFLQVQDGGYESVGNILERMSEIKTSTLDISKNSTDISHYNTEFKQLQTQILNIQKEKFNGVSLYNSYSAEDAGFLSHFCA